METTEMRDGLRLGDGGSGESAIFPDGGKVSPIETYNIAFA